MGLKGSTKPTGLLVFSAATAYTLGLRAGGWYWLFLVSLLFVIGFDSYRVSLHEEKHGCSDG